MDRQLLPGCTLTTVDRVIHIGQASVIRCILEDYTRGKCARTIAIELNRAGIFPYRLSKGE
jgi:hypothetical protein